MREKFLPLFLLFIIFNFLFGCSDKEVKQFADGKVKEITKYQVEPSHGLLSVTKGFPPALGSSLHFLKEENDVLYFYSISDRGPNAPVYYKEQNKLIFFYPEFQPFIAELKVTKDKAKVIDFFSIEKENGKFFTGMPVRSQGTLHFYTPVNKDLKEIIEYDDGIDSESITVDQKGNIWIGEEHNPSIIKIDGQTKKVVRIYKPGDGLPEFVQHIQMNRGFESLAVAPNGKVYAIVEGVLDFNKQASTALFIRVLELDPETDQVRTFVYFYDQDVYPNPKEVKIGDLAALNNDEFLVIEQGYTRKGDFRNIIYKINIENATDITNKLAANGLFLEYGSEDELSNVNAIKKTLVVDMNKYGWDKEKLEGLAVIDSTRIALTNDNDFGIGEIELKNECKGLSCVKYIVSRPEQKQYTQMWIVELNKSLTDNFSVIPR
jgi:hypothetical protein